MLGKLILLFTVVPLVELALLITVGREIGVFNTISIVVITGVIGAYLARSQGISTLGKIQSSMQRGVMPANEILDGFMILAGGLMLITPGLITDAAGFLTLIPRTRNMLKSLIVKKLKKIIDSGNVQIHIGL
ncbi:MAG: FxsA family protein [Candidatus Tritonobacter lacicola]|nr:FxsA family protein [Candidatus Tritonobacter lacicola]